jgi:hypothetical protein
MKKCRLAVGHRSRQQLLKRAARPRLLLTNCSRIADFLLRSMLAPGLTT